MSVLRSPTNSVAAQLGKRNFSALETSPSNVGNAKKVTKEGLDTNSFKYSPTPKMPNEKTATKNAVAYALPTKNMFAPLASTSSAVTGSPTKSATQQKPRAIPPFVIAHSDINKLQECLKSNGIIEYSLKYMSVGIKLNVSKSDIYNQIKECLLATKIRFYTHEIDPAKLRKFVLTGLPHSDMTEIKDDMTSQGLTPFEVTELKTKYSSFTALYKVVFTTNVKMIDLKKIKFINHVKVNWRNFYQQSRGPTLCTSCNLYGHGSRNCHLDKRCKKCGENHILSDCTASDDAVKCCNCNGNHAADFEECPSRISFMQMRKKFASTRKLITPAAVRPAFTKENFPPISLAPAPRIPSAWSTGQFSFGASSQIPRQTPQADLFDSSEITQIVMEIFTGLQQCKSKQDQLLLMFEITSKHIYNAVP